jgi:hypothetical protein
MAIGIGILLQSMQLGFVNNSVLGHFTLSGHGGESVRRGEHESALFRSGTAVTLYYSVIGQDHEQMAERAKLRVQVYREGVEVTLHMI